MELFLPNRFDGGFACSRIQVYDTLSTTPTVTDRFNKRTAIEQAPQLYI